MKISQKHKQYLRSALYSWRFPIDIIYCLLKFGYWDQTWRLYGTPLITKHSRATIKIGKKWIVCSDAKFNSLGVFQKVTVKAIRPQSKIIIGNNVGMSGVSISCLDYISIGDNTLLGSGCIITDNDAHGIHPDFRNSPDHILTAPVIVGENVFIGARAIVLKGVSIGNGAVVGAGAVVTRNVEAMSIVAGNPAKKIGDVRDSKFSSKHANQFPQ